MPGLKNARPALDMTQPLWLMPCDGAYTGHASRMVRTIEQQDCMSGGGGSSRKTQLSMEQKLAAALELLLPAALPGASKPGSARWRLLHHIRVMQVCGGRQHECVSSERSS